MRAFARAGGILVVVLAAFAGGCSEDDSSNGLSGVAPDFALPDVNPNSATYDSTISPRDYLSKVSAWYFGHST